MYIAVFSVRTRRCDCWETHRATAYLFQAISHLASGDFAMAGTSKWISPTSPPAINGLFFFSPFLSCLRSLGPSKHPIVSWVHPWKQYLACFNEWMLTRSDPHFFSTLFFLLLQINHRTVQRLTAANPRLMQPPSLNVKHNEKKKTSPERLTYFIWILFGFKALIDCAMFRTIWPW